MGSFTELFMVDADKAGVRKLLGELLASLDKARPHLHSIISSSACRATGGTSLEQGEDGKDLARARLCAQAALSLSNIQAAKVMLSLPFDKEAFDESATERARLKRLLAQIDAAEGRPSETQAAAARRVRVDPEASKRVLKSALWQPPRNEELK